MVFDTKAIPEPLFEEYRKGRCGLLVGAGASVGAGLPTWSRLLTEMIISARGSVGLSNQKAEDYERLIGTGKFLTVASGLKEDMGSYFADFIRKTFLKSTVAPTDFHSSLVGMRNLQFVLTTNYDTLIERAWRASDPNVTVCTYKDAGEVRRSLSAREFFILKAHGDATRTGEGIILTEQDYRAILYREAAYQHMLATMFSMFTIIFVGASMSDPELNLMLNYISSTFAPDTGPIHYAALTAEETTDVERERWFKDFKIKVIPVSSADEYADLDKFVRALAS